MKTNENKNLEEETIKVPLDMVPDIFSIIVTQRIWHELTEASAERWYFRMIIQYDKTDVQQKKAVTDIKRLLDTYYEYRNASHDELNWR